MSEDNNERDKKLQFLGWILFVICAILFIASSIRNGDWLSLAASILFLVACIFFMIPFMGIITADDSDKTPK